MQEKQHSTAATAISGLFSLSCLALGAPIAAAIAAGAATINAANSRDEEEVVRRGAAAYNQLLRESVEEGAASGCWQQVSEQLLLLQQQTIEDACSSKGEPFRELIALTRMRCIYIRSGRLFPGPAEGCYLFPHEVPASWMHTNVGVDGGAVARDASLSHPCLQLNEVLRQLQQLQQIQQLQQLSTGEWDDKDEQQQQQQRHQQEEPTGVATETTAEENADAAAIAEKKVELIFGDQSSPLLQLQGLQQRKQQLYRHCIALTRRQTAACQQHRAMDFGTFALVREQINHIDNICFFLHSAERQRRAEEAAVRLSAASAAAAARMQQQLQQLEHMGKLQEQLQLQQLQGGSYMQQLLLQLQRGLEECFTVLQQLKAFHRAVGEWLGGGEAAALYFAAGVAAFFFTVSSRVAAARLQLFCLLAASAAAEIALHRGGLSPYLNMLMQHQHRPHSESPAYPAGAATAATATAYGVPHNSTLAWIADAAWTAAATTAAAAAVVVSAHGVSLVRWSCFLAACWLWMRCFWSYTSPEQQLQQQLRLLQEQVYGVRQELHEAQAAGEPRMQEMQQLLQQLLQRVAAKDAAVQQLQQLQWEEGQLRQQQQHEAEQAQEQQQQSLACRAVRWAILLAVKIVISVFAAVVAAVASGVPAAWMCFLLPLRVCGFRKASGGPAASWSSSTSSESSSSSNTKRSCTSKKEDNPNNLLSGVCLQSYRSRRYLLQQQLRRRGPELPLGLRQQSLRYNEDEGEAADPSYQPSTSSSSNSRSNGTSSSEPEYESPAVATDAAETAAVEPRIPPATAAEPPAAAQVPHQEQQQQPAKTHSSPQQQSPQQPPLPQQRQQHQQAVRRNPVRACRVLNFRRVEDPQHPDVFMREVIPPERLKALQRRNKRLDNASPSETSCSNSSSSIPPTDSRSCSPSAAGAPAKQVKIYPAPTLQTVHRKAPIKTPKHEQQQQQQQHQHQPRVSRQPQTRRARGK